MKRLLCLFVSVALPLSVASTVAAEPSLYEELEEEFGVDIVAPYQSELHSPFSTEEAGRRNRRVSRAFRCEDQRLSLGGFGDTFRRSDTRRCFGQRRGVSAKGGFVPGLVNRTYVASFSPCVRGTGFLFTPEGRLVARGSTRSGCPNGRATVDFCLRNGGGAVAMARRFGEQGILQWTTSRGTECFYVKYRCTIRNGRFDPNRPGVNERGEPSLRGVCQRDRRNRRSRK